MTLSDSILLKISNSKITYNDLLTSILSNYSSKSSAKAALSRSLKNLIAFENIIKHEDYYILTSKGKTIVESKLKNKMLITINELINKVQKNKDLRFLEDVIKNLQIFIERSKQEPTLLRIGKTSSTFFISDLINIKKDLESTIKHYDYLLHSLEKQILILQEQNFVDQKIVELDSNGLENIRRLCEFYNIEEIIVEIGKNPCLINLFKNNFEFNFKSEGTFKLNIASLNVFKKIIFNNLETILNSNFKIFVNEITIYINGSKMKFVGPHNLIVDIL